MFLRNTGPVAQRDGTRRSDKTKDNFINVHIDPSGCIQAFDAQDGTRYGGRGLNYRLGTVDLFMRLRL